MIWWTAANALLADSIQSARPGGIIMVESIADAQAMCIAEQRRQFEATQFEFGPLIGGWVPKTDRSIEQAAAEHRRKIAAMERETTRWNWGLMVGATALVVWTALMALGVV